LKPDHQSPVEAAGRFLTNRWSVTLLSPQSEASSKAAGTDDPYGAQDLDQSFFLHLDQNEASLSCQVTNALQAGVGLINALIHRPREQYICLLREEVSRTVGALIAEGRWSGP
jgi:hypothetical protein